jgi:hypothetical protein
VPPQSVRDHCPAPERVDARVYGGRNRSLFEDLPPLRVDAGALHALPTRISGAERGTDDGRIIGEVIDGDPESFRSVDPAWSPTPPGRDGAFGHVDILAPTD